MQKKIQRGFTIGSFPESAVYAFVNSFYLLFLTSVAGLNPTAASSIVSICLLIESLSAVVFGRLSDQSTSKFGKRRPFIFAAGILLPLALVFSFLTIEAAPFVKFLYYAVFGGFVKALYSAYYIPYIALGAEITTDYDARTRQRTICKIYCGIGNIFGYICPLLVVDYLVSLGLEPSRSWLLYVLFLGLAVLFGFMVCWKMTDGCEKTGSQIPEIQKEPFSKVLHTYRELFKLKPMAILVLWKIFFSIAYTLTTSSLVFYLLYKLQLPGSSSSQVYTVSVLISFVSIPIVGITALKIGKKLCVQIYMLIAGFFGIALYFIGIHSLFAVMLYIIAYSFAHSTFWQLTYPLFYDICEADFYAYGKRREGDITSMQSVLGTIASAITTQFLGLILSQTGFHADAVTQPDAAILALDWIFILLPSIFLIFAACILIRYPLSKKVHAALCKCLYENQRENLDHYIYFKR